MSDYLVKSKAEVRGGILVLHAWWGLNEFSKEFCNRLANEGYLVLAPDLYNGAIAKTIPEAEKLSGKLKREPTSKQIVEALKQLRNETKQPVGLVGFSLGAYWGLWLVEEKPKDIAATVLFYGARGGDFAQTKSAFIGHFAETDEFVSDSGRKKLEKTLKATSRVIEFHVYPETRHWFFENDRPEFKRQAAELAWQRTIQFLHTHIERST